jgi:hypothetical protein
MQWRGVVEFIYHGNPDWNNRCGLSLLHCSACAHDHLTHTHTHIQPRRCHIYVADKYKNEIQETEGAYILTCSR